MCAKRSREQGLNRVVYSHSLATVSQGFAGAEQQKSWNASFPNTPEGLQDMQMLGALTG